MATVRQLHLDLVLVRNERSESADPGDHPLVVRMKEVRAVLVDANPGAADLVVCVTADVPAPVDDIDAEAALGQLAGIRRAGKAGADDQNGLVRHVPS